MVTKSGEGIAGLPQIRVHREKPSGDKEIRALTTREIFGQHVLQ